MIQLTSDSFFSDDDTEILPLVTKLGLLDGLSKPVGWEGPIVKTVYGPLKSGGHAIFVRWMDMPDSSENGYLRFCPQTPRRFIQRLNP